MTIFSLKSKIFITCLSGLIFGTPFALAQDGSVPAESTVKDPTVIETPQEPMPTIENTAVAPTDPRPADPALVGTNPGPLVPGSATIIPSPKPTSTITPVPTASTFAEPKIASSPNEIIPVAVSSVTEETPGGLNLITWLGGVLAGLLVLFGLGAWAKMVRNKTNKKGNCFDLKQMMEKKLKELTDIRGFIEDKTKATVRKAVITTVAETRAGILIARAEKIEKEYKRIKKLFEECLLEVERQTFTGVIIEESLEDKEILKKVKIIDTNIETVTETHRTPWVKQWTMHTVKIPASKAGEVAKQLRAAMDKMHADSWYIDFKNPTTHFVVYANKVFLIDRSKKKEYAAAQDHGRKLGLPDDQLDFVPGK